MRSRTTRLGAGILRALLASSALAIAVTNVSEARAETDTFGVGDGHSGAKTVAGTETINSYASITADVAPGATTISFGTVIGNPAGFAANDLVLVWRATGVDAAEAPSGNQTKRLDLATSLATTSGASAPGLAGTFELVRVQSVAGSTITLTKPLVKGFTKLVSQIVRVPEYTTVNVPAGATLVASAWQEVGGDPAAPNPSGPWAGGIVIFMATGAVTNNGTIHANARGFHGGTPVQRALSLALACDTNAVDGNSETGSFAPKGEGVVHTKFVASSGGKGNISLAGGGGNCTESGGGGGANQGNGGAGSGTALNLGSGGLGGVGVDYSVLDRLSMGGGGGAGRHNVGIGLLSSEVAFGGFGGGVVYIRAASMDGATGKLQANGGDGESSGIANLPAGVASQGSGGGGAGGTIVVRLTGTLDCDALATAGGNGGSAEVAGLPVFGAGGGGGGGRVFFQAATKGAGCDIVVTPGSPGNGGQGGSQAGNPGGSTPGSGFCFDNTPGAPGACADGSPVCDVTTGQCNKCDGPFSSATPHACGVNVKPVCLTTGACVPCDGDFNSGTAQACQLVGSPTCFPTGGPTVAGSCGKCTTNADCVGPGHPGPVCNVVAGACGTSCTKDEDCKPTEWCAPRDANGANVCIPKTPNAQPVPPFPPIDGECTKEKGKRVCLSAVCEVDDDLCGLKNSSPCTDAKECRSSICFPADKLCGLPNGEPCTGDGQCRSQQCKDGLCTGCGSDNDCKLGEVCDPNVKNCVPGCRPGSSSSTDGGAPPHGACPAGQECVAADGGPIGQCQPIADAGLGGDASIGGGDAGDTSGIVEGGGCSCNANRTEAMSPFAILGVLGGSLLVARRRQRRRVREESGQEDQRSKGEREG